MKIGILSDTHGYLHPKFKEILIGCDTLIHAGDFASEKIYQELKDLGVPMYMVKGNTDRGAWAAFLPETLTFSISGHLFYLIHDRTQIPFPLPKTEFLIYGHTHRFDHSKHGDVTLVNPGSATESRTTLPPSIAILSFSENGHDIERIFDSDPGF
ncbi:MAG: metallophosphoesterase family protein [Lachnospiraceae bacterium]